MFEKESEEWFEKLKQAKVPYTNENVNKQLHKAFQDGAEFGYNKANEEHEEKCKTAYIKGIRTMANALKDYDRTDGAWTDYFEHTVEKVLKKLLQESE